MILNTWRPHVTHPVREGHVYLSIVLIQLAVAVLVNLLIVKIQVVEVSSSQSLSY
jgi:hypothetical protein